MSQLVISAKNRYHTSNKNFMKPIVIIFGVLSVIVIGAIIIVATQSGDPSASKTNTNQTSNNTNSNNTGPNTNPNGQAGKYIDYTPDILERELREGNKVVLYFTASWCPFCKAADQAFRNKLSEIPVGVSVLRVNYDKSDDLKKTYGITYQHTFVQIDADRNFVTKWSGGDIDALKQNLK